MNTTTENAALADVPPPPAGSAPSADEIAMTRAALNGAKVRAGSKFTINTKTMTTRQWPIIEVWYKAQRRYLPLSVGEVWRYETAEERDAVLSALQNTAMRDQGHQNQSDHE
jgi:hypothetical protein